MLIAGHLLVHDGSTSRLERGWLLARDRLIVQMGAGEAPAAADLGGDDFIIMPGFVDAHVHLPQYDAIGIAGLELLEWLERVIFPAEALWADTDYAAAMAQRSVRGLISFGTTAMAAYASVHGAGARAAMEAAAALGVRGVLGPSLMDRNAPPELCLPREVQLAELARFERVGRLEPAVTPRFAVACTPELMRDAAQLAARRGWTIQTHLAETHAEVALVESLFPGRSYTQVYDDVGLLTPRTILAHTIHLAPADAALIESRGSCAAHCPTANRFLEAGIMDRAGLATAGIPVALGSDVAGGPDRSMVRVARAMIESARARGDAAPTAAQAFHAITAGSAAALGWHGCGTLTTGVDADVVVVRPDRAWLTSPDPLGTLLYSWDDRWIRSVLVAGRVMFTA